MDAGLAPEGTGVGVPLPSQLELSRQVLTTVLSEDAGHGVQNAAPCLLMHVLQKEAQSVATLTEPGEQGRKEHDIEWEVAASQAL